MKKMIERIKVACQSGAITALVCLAQPAPSLASDIELYRAPQSTQTTLMFMLDVSGSMGSDGTNGAGDSIYTDFGVSYKASNSCTTENLVAGTTTAPLKYCPVSKATKNTDQCTDGKCYDRLSRLQKGLINLLQGTPTIERLPDDLVAGLSTFNDKTGRIKLAAKRLDTPVLIATGNRQVYRETTIRNQPQTRTQGTTTTRTDTLYEERTQTRKCYPFIGCDSYSNWTNYALKVIPGTSTPSPSDSGWINSGISTTSTTREECKAWQSNNLTCQTWQSTTKTASDFNTTGSTETGEQPGTAIPGSTHTDNNSSTLGPIDLNPATTDTTTTTSCGLFCSQDNHIQTKLRQQITYITIETTNSNRTIPYTNTTTYTATNSYTTHRQSMMDTVAGLSASNGTPTAFGYAEVAAYLMNQTTNGVTNSGISESASADGVVTNNTYNAPGSINKSNQCNTQGIYFLTDGVPEYGKDNSSLDIMKKSLGTLGSSFTCSADSLGGKTPYYNQSNNTNNWTCIGEYTKRLLNGSVDANNNPTNNPAGVSIKTAVVGFGSDMAADTPSASYANDIADAKAWGALGQGGFYKGNNDAAVVDSVKAFLKILDKYIPSVTTGSVTIPVDALDTQNVQPWAYYPQFDPKPGDTATGVITWFGNVKKYKTLNNSLIDRDGAAITDSNGLLKDDINDYWAASGVTKVITKRVAGVDRNYTVKVGGALSQLVLGYNAAATPAERRSFTDRNIIVDPDDSTKNKINTITDGGLKKIGRADFLSTSTNQFKEDPKRGYLLSLYGYAIPKDLAVNLSLYPKDSGYQTSLEQSLTATPGRDWLMGAVMHSKPILLTQEGTTKYENDVLTYDNRDDLILYGTTQGVLHVVKAGKNATDTNAGKELFAFVPNEMIENQAEGFLSQASQSGTLKYGVDGQWTAYTEYVTKKGSQTTDEPVITVKGGKQWVYGGLRMGGKSYYALDLTDVSSSDNSSVPKIKFRIDPASATSGPLSYMGQSWSKPTIGWVNWKGKRKLVMFVGGGYDMGYEADNYAQSNGIGAGVYMFDANNGDLLWWASSNATDANSSATEQAKNVTDMSYSVVSQIKSVDRNNDGLVDHLYFGDLGGQLWRIDLDNSLSSSSTSAFANHAVKLLNLHVNAGSSPRFYTTPTFTIHSGGSSGLFAAITLGSGDLSSPMSAAGANGKDAVYVIYDKDVTKANLYQLAESALTSKNIVKGTTGNTLAANSDGKTNTDLTRGGWYAPLNSKYRVLNDTVAIDSDLYVSVFDANQDIAASCEGGVRGKSDVYQFCLPYGQCTETVAGEVTPKNPPASIFLGKGNIGIAFGGITGENSSNRSLILNVPKPTGQNLPNYAGKLKFVSQRWYEKYAKAS